MVFQLKLFLLIVLMVQLSEASSRLSTFNTFISTTKSEDDDSTAWAILVAGSNGFYNYRHQADVCHAYQILKRGGLKDENIIVFMYDDIANDIDNSRPGVIINHPNGSDVYAGVPKDYTGRSVNADNFYAVLLGNATKVKGAGSGKVVASKPKDKIFIFYSDHGGPGILGMPVTPFIFADEFINVLKTKHASGTYDEMVIYLESCESGSIFEGLLPKNLNIYVTTASNATENSWATYCPDDNNDHQLPELDTCLGDLYSVSWMEDSDSEDLRRETLEQQYLKVKKRTLNSHASEGSNVMQYGTLSIYNETVSVYQGSSNGSVSEEPGSISMGMVNQRDADLYSMWRKYNRSTGDFQQKEKLLKEIKEITAHRSHLDNSVNMISRYLLDVGHGPVRGEGSALVDDWGCLRSMVRVFERDCGSLTQYGMKHTRTFANLCNNGVPEKAMETVTKMACSSYKMGQFNPAIVGYSA